MKKLNKNVLMILAVAVLLIVGIIGMTIIKSENTKQQETEVVTQELEDTKQEEASIEEDPKEKDEEAAANHPAAIKSLRLFFIVSWQPPG